MTVVSSRTDWVAIGRELGPMFAERSEAADEGDSFVADNYADLKRRGIFSAGIPEELGGGGATHGELCDLVTEIARHCSATALALSMHLHPVAVATWKWRQGQPVAPVLRRIAAEQLVLVSTGASDWLGSSGDVERVDGGFRVRARKRFASGCPAGDLLVTSAPYDDPAEGAQVLHFAVPFGTEGLRIEQTWRAMGMRGTGSHDVVLDEIFVPDSAIELRRRRGWHFVWIPVLTIALPLIMATYVGIAESAASVALSSVAPRRDDPNVQLLVGEMRNSLAAAKLAHADMVRIAANYELELRPETVDAVLTRKTIVAESAIRAVEKAMECVGGASYLREHGLERRLRDVCAARLHPLHEKRQLRFAGRIALGLEPSDD